MRFFDFVGIFSQILQSRNRRQNAGYPKTGNSVEMAKNVSRETLGGHCASDAGIWALRQNRSCIAFVGTRRAVSAYFLTRKKPLKTFHRNVFKIKKQQAGHRAERSCSLRPRKAVAFLTHLPRAPEAWRREFRCLRTATQRATRPLRTPRQLRSAGTAFSGERF